MELARSAGHAGAAWHEGGRGESFTRPPGASLTAVNFTADGIGAFRPLEATARASAQISATYRANPTLPWSLYLKGPGLQM